jgi:hypothetical protein
LATVSGSKRADHRKVDIWVGRSDFYNPVYSLTKQIKESLDPERQPKEVRSVDVSSVNYQAPSSNRRRYGKVTKILICKRQKKIGGHFIRAWPASHTYGMFFLYPEKVILHTWTQEKGFQVTLCPEEGLNIPRK